MQITTTAVVVFVLVARISRGEIVIATPNPDKSTNSLVDDLAQVIASCYGNRTEVGLIGYVLDDIAKALSTQHFIPVVLIDSSQSYTQTRKTQFHHKLHVFVAEVFSVDHFTFIIEEKLQFSIWWNHMASIFILDRSAGCYAATDYLLRAWESNLLNAKFLCDDPVDGRVILTFNPYTSEAPTPWRRIFTITGIRDHPFNVFLREFGRNAETCANLDFDKTKDLGGYPIAVLGNPLGHEVRHNSTPNIEQFWRKQDRIFYTFSRALNTSLIFIHAIEHYDMVKDNTVFHYQWDQTEAIYPLEEIGLVIITQFRGHKSQLSKILFVIDVDSRIGLGIVYLITLIFFKFIVRQAIVPACLNLVRITCNTGFANLTHYNAPRIYLTSLLFFAVTMQGIYQGNLAALLTQWIPLRQVNTMQDLADFGYKIYGHTASTNLVDDHRLRERYTAVNEDDNCVAYVINDPSAACLGLGRAVIFDLAREFNLHISNEFVELYYIGHETHFDWPLQEKTDVTFSKLVEADILEPWNDKCNPTKWSDFQIDAEVRKNKDFKVMELGELAFSFVILGVGLLCATVTFIGELAIQYKCIFLDRQVTN